MTDIQKLKALAEAARSGGAKWSDLDINTERMYVAEGALVCLYEFGTPAVLLELIAEIDRLEERNVYWIDQANTIARDRNTVRAERDQLKTENTALHATLQAAKGEIERLKGENEALRAEAAKWKNESVSDSQTIYSLSCNLAQRTGEVRELADVVDDLSALTKRFVQRLRKAAPGNDLPEKALDYLKRKGLQGSTMREIVEGRLS